METNAQLWYIIREYISSAEVFMTQTFFELYYFSSVAISMQGRAQIVPGVGILDFEKIF